MARENQIVYALRVNENQIVYIVVKDKIIDFQNRQVKQH